MTKNSKDLGLLLENFDTDQLEIITGIVLRLAAVRAERWTGKINFEINANQGGFGDMHVNRGEVVRLQKKRRVRSSGI